MPASSLARGALLNLMAKGATVALGLGVLTVVARLGPEVQGAFSLFVAVESALLTLGSGPGLWLAREVSHHGRPPAERLSAALALALGLGVVLGMVLAGWSALATRLPYTQLWLLALAAPCLLLVNTSTGLWLGQGRMLRMNAPLVAAPALVLALLALGMWRGGAWTTAGVLAVWVAAKTLVGLGAAGAALAQEGLARPDWAGLRGQWRFMAVIAVTNLVSLANYRVSLFLVERSQGLAATGVYSVAVQVAELLWLLSSSVTLSAYHRIGSGTAQEAARTTLHAVRVNVMTTLAVAPLLLALAHWALPWALGPAYAPALKPLALLLPGVAGYAAASSLSAYFTNHRGQPQWSTRIAGLSLLLNASLGAWAIPHWGPGGAALATSAAYLIAITVALHSFLRATGLGWRHVFGRAIADNPSA